jgi:hypothetical protein
MKKKRAKKQRNLGMSDLKGLWHLYPGKELAVTEDGP